MYTVNLIWHTENRDWPWGGMQKNKRICQSPIFLEDCKWRQTAPSLCWASTPLRIKIYLTYNLRYIIKWEFNSKRTVPSKLQTVSSIFTLCMTGKKIEVAWEQWEVIHLEKPLIYSINRKQVKKGGFRGRICEISWRQRKEHTMFYHSRIW